MEKPEEWPKVLSFSILAITVMYLLVGIPAYLTYGQSVQSPVYLSLPPGFSATISIIMITVHLLLALPIYQTSFSMEIEYILLSKLESRVEFTCRTILRLLIVAFTVYMAINVPFAADLVELLGAAGNGALLVIVPILLWLKLFGWSKLGLVEKGWIVFMLVYSILGAVFGTIDALKALWGDYYTDIEP
ncbi:109_t:CDS:1 [Acaulospora colombiana]|uniref:109_t:CDS:1 n=1 Tax=Acaulospora colombiana TaxID=27376 RepID=A0ACA9NER7_9GLOM|nr:109_t:CDS:1 [Acaulospora colombiana]